MFKDFEDRGNRFKALVRQRFAAPGARRAHN
jgi:hypothetical protein